MTPENFCYWLQGWFELNETIDHREGATVETIDIIKNHLALVFAHSDLQYGDKLEKMQEIHDGKPAYEKTIFDRLDEDGAKPLDPEAIEKIQKIMEEWAEENENRFKRGGLRPVCDHERRLTC